MKKLKKRCFVYILRESLLNLAEIEQKDLSHRNKQTLRHKQPLGVYLVCSHTHMKPLPRHSCFITASGTIVTITFMLIL